jgi:hypothetical protein
VRSRTSGTSSPPSSGASESPELADAMAGYMELVTGGRREIYKLE